MAPVAVRHPAARPVGEDPLAVVDPQCRPPAADQDDSWILAIDDSLLNATAWSAPSDALLPESDPDIFTTLPMLFESTETEVDALL